MWYGAAAGIIAFVIWRIVRTKQKEYRKKEKAYGKYVKMIWLYAGVTEALGTLVQVRVLNRYEVLAQVDIEGRQVEMTIFVPKWLKSHIKEGAVLPFIYNEHVGEAAIHPEYTMYLQTKNNEDVQSIIVQEHLRN